MTAPSPSATKARAMLSMPECGLSTLTAAICARFASTGRERVYPRILGAGWIRAYYVAHQENDPHRYLYRADPATWKIAS
jgi:hypothetical protein